MKNQGGTYDAEYFCKKTGNSSPVCSPDLCVYHVNPDSNTRYRRYIHPGDAVVILSGIFLDPVTAFLVAGIGSCMADLLGGYFIYVPITFAVKGLVAAVTSVVYCHVVSKGKSRKLAVLYGGIADILLVAGGYFLFESVLYGPAAALLSLSANGIQGISGLVIAGALYPGLERLL